MDDAHHPPRNGALRPSDREPSEDALRRSEARYRALVEASGQAVWSWSPGGAAVDLPNTLQWWEDVTGQTVAEQRRAPHAWLDMVHPDDREAAGRAWGATAATGAPYDIEYRVRGRAGGWRYIKARGVPVPGPDDAPLEWVGTLQDVTDQRAAEAARRESEERFRGLVTATSDVVYRMSPDWTEVLHLEGRDLAAAPAGPSRGWLDAHVPPDERERVAAAVAAAVRERRPFELEHRVVRGDGTTGWALSRAVPMFGPRGDLVEWFGAASDVTRRRQAEEDLKASQGRLAAALRTARMCAWTWDPAADRVVASDTAADVYGLRPGEPFDSSRVGFGLVHPDDLDRHRALVGRAVERGESWHAEFRIVRPVDGRVAWLEERATAERDPAGAVRMTGLVWDVTDRKVAEAEAARLTEKLRLALDAADLGTWEWDPATDEMTVSDRAAEMYGMPPGVPHGREVGRQAIHPDDRERARQAAARAVAEKTDYDIEYRLADRPVWVAARGRGEYDPAGNLVRVHGVVQDVTARRRAAEALERVTAESERRKRLYEAVLDSTPDLAYVWGLDHRFAYANEGLLRLWGKTWDEAVGKTCLELGYEPWQAAMHDREIDQVVASKQPVRGEVPFAGAFGRRIHDYLLVPVIGADGEVEAVAGTTRDITDLKASEEELKKQTERLRLLWEAASVLLTTDEPDAMLRGLFDRLAGHFGLDAYLNFMVEPGGEFLRLESCVGLPPGAAESVRRLAFGQGVCGAVARTRRPIAAADVQRSDDPRVQLVKGFGVRAYACNPLVAGDRLLGTLSFASRTRDAFGPDELEFFRTVCYYVTVAYERLRLVRELRDQDRKKDEFIALLAHELRNPLAPVRNGLQVLRMAGGNPEAAARARDIMDRQLTHMVRLIDDLLDVSRITRNKLHLRRARVPLADVVASAVETARPALDAGGHELTVSLPAAPVVLDADLTRLAQVFSNLLTNSAKYTPRGGQVWLSAERTGGRVAVSVRDTGIGIPAASLPAIFDMFSQVDRSAERAAGGLGIGLALVKGLVEMHGGTVTAASDGEGRGTTFTVSLPEAGAPASAAGPAADAGGAAGPARRVLVVDDNRDGAESMAEMLALLGHEVATAHDGLEAVERAEAFRPDVILMDIAMPRLNGLDATRRIRGRDWGRGITVVALTGWGQDTDRERSRAAGCDAHLVKPVSVGDLQRVLAEVAGGGR